MHIYVRHGHDQKSHRAKFDDRLSDEGKKKARRRARKLIKKYGVPSVIYCSPMYRTRQTAKEFLKVIKKQQVDGAPPPEIVIEPRLGRLFTTKQRRHYEKHTNRAVRKSTENIVLDQGKLAFRQRVEAQVHSLPRDSVTWNVTHSLVILHAARMHNIERAPHVKYLDTLIINQ
uniref:Uncharacterized protein n=1 Tax=viral metagenome TaxID=1070528 RepID=A0A6C0BNY2_9ZZZZ